MKKEYRVNYSQKINNFYSFATIFIMSIVMLIYYKYISPHTPKSDTKPQLQCQKETYSFDKVFDKQLLQKGFLLYKNGLYNIEGGVIYSEYMPSKFKDIVNIENIDKTYQDKIKYKTKNDKNVYLKIKYEIIENDKKDPNKKNESCKLNEGSLMTSFRINGKELYRIFIDFNDLEELDEKIDCSIKAFENNAN